MSDEFRQRLEAVERLTALYRPERTVHLVVTTISLIILLSAGGAILYQDPGSITGMGIMFGAGGIVSYTAAQLLKMWDRCITVVAMNQGDANGD